MSSRSFAVDDKIEDYVESINPYESDIEQRLRDLTQQMPQATMQIGASQGQFMAMLAKVMNAKRYLEIGVFTGYSSLVMAQALPEDGQVVGCDISEDFTNIAKQYWKEAGVEHKIDLRIGPASESLDKLIAEGQEGKFDIAFIDADKQSNPAYIKRCLRLVRQNGLILIDNILRNGKVLDREPDVEIQSQIDFNESLRKRDDIDVVSLPIFDGLTLVRKK